MENNTFIRVEDTYIALNKIVCIVKENENYTSIWYTNGEYSSFNCPVEDVLDTLKLALTQTARLQR